jgi:hypothetical protein
MLPKDKKFQLLDLENLKEFIEKQEMVLILLQKNKSIFLLKMPQNLKQQKLLKKQ